MECNKCGNEIILTGAMAYCPYCGSKLIGEPTNKGILTKELKVNDSVKALIIWLLLCGIFAVFFIVFKQMLSNLLGFEIPGLMDWIILLGIAAAAMYFTLAYVVFNHAKKNNRRAVAWATAFIGFTPLLGGLLYLLSWPKE